MSSLLYSSSQSSMGESDESPAESYTGRGAGAGGGGASSVLAGSTTGGGGPLMGGTGCFVSVEDVTDESSDLGVSWGELVETDAAVSSTALSSSATFSTGLSSA